MKKFWHRYKHIIILLVVWRIILFAIERIAPFFIPLHDGYNGPIPWANHDGIHYLTIAKIGYFNYSEAFFPLYPLLIKGASVLSPLPFWTNAVILSSGAFVLAVFVLYDFLMKKHPHRAWQTILLLIAFPTSFFFCAVYTEGIFFLWSILVYVSVERKQWLLAGICGALASATRLFGVALFIYAALTYIMTVKQFRIRDCIGLCLMPLGLVGYMGYLYMRSGDPLLFFHIQPAFGANRSGSSLILLPQVVWRYMKILFTAFLKPTPASYFITVLEFITTIFGYSIVYVGWKLKEKIPLLVYSIVALTLPTLTGTFSSMPRYVLSVFPLFLILGSIQNKKIAYTMLGVFIVFQIILSGMFLRGWFVA